MPSETVPSSRRRNARSVYLNEIPGGPSRITDQLNCQHVVHGIDVRRRVAIDQRVESINAGRSEGVKSVVLSILKDARNLSQDRCRDLRRSVERQDGPRPAPNPQPTCPVGFRLSAILGSRAIRWCVVANLDGLWH